MSYMYSFTSIIALIFELKSKYLKRLSNCQIISVFQNRSVEKKIKSDLSMFNHFVTENLT